MHLIFKLLVFLNIYFQIHCNSLFLKLIYCHSHIDNPFQIQCISNDCIMQSSILVTVMWIFDWPLQQGLPRMILNLTFHDWIQKETHITRQAFYLLWWLYPWQDILYSYIILLWYRIVVTGSKNILQHKNFIINAH